jgi:hypothetical protein
LGLLVLAVWVPSSGAVRATTCTPHRSPSARRRKTANADDGKTKFLKEGVPLVEELIGMRNAVEHPEGLSGKLVIAHFTFGA